MDASLNNLYHAVPNESTFLGMLKQAPVDAADGILTLFLSKWSSDLKTAMCKLHNAFSELSLDPSDIQDRTWKKISSSSLPTVLFDIANDDATYLHRNYTSDIVVFEHPYLVFMCLLIHDFTEIYFMPPL